eukprot:7341204-Pyramimonas_sp.AAC.1
MFALRSAASISSKGPLNAVAYRDDLVPVGRVLLGHSQCTHRHGIVTRKLVRSAIGVADVFASASA